MCIALSQYSLFSIVIISSIGLLGRENVRHCESGITAFSAPAYQDCWASLTCASSSRGRRHCVVCLRGSSNGFVPWDVVCGVDELAGWKLSENRLSQVPTGTRPKAVWADRLNDSDVLPYRWCIEFINYISARDLANLATCNGTNHV